MENYEFVGMVVLVGIPAIASVFKLAVSVANFTTSVDRLVDWQKKKDEEDKKRDSLLEIHDQLLDKHADILDRNNLK